MPLEHQTDHETTGLLNRIGIYKEEQSPVLEAILKSYLPQIQAIEDAAMDVLNLRWPDTAEGEQLNVLGRIVGEQRQGRGDAAYASAIQARIKINRSSGTRPELITILELLTSNSFHFENTPPAAFVVWMAGAMTDDEASYLALALGDAQLAGVNGQLVYHNEATDVLTLGDSTLSTSTSQGLADVSKTTGGDAAGVIET